MLERFFTHSGDQKTSRTRRSGHRTAPSRALRLSFEALEERRLLAADGLSKSVLKQRVEPLSHPIMVLNSSGKIAPRATAAPTGLSPAQVRHAYGFDQITFSGGTIQGDGDGMTVAIVNAYDNPNIANDLNQFSTAYGLPLIGQNGFTFRKVSQTGSTTPPPPPPAIEAGWASETALDVQWVHAIAPKADILLVEATDSSYLNMMAAVDYARSQPGVVAVSMSWGSDEFTEQTTLDSRFATPAGHPGVTFFAASGDAGAPASYPSASPNVVSVGGTTMLVDSAGNILSETGWVGGGGGVSLYEPKPAYQSSLTHSATRRATPDVALDSDPWTGVSVYDTYLKNPLTPWVQYGGTSAAAPQWAALSAIVSQGRGLAGLGSLTNTEFLTALYQMPASNFHDITAGGSAGSPMIPATAGYDLATGLGSPVANLLVGALTNTTSTAPATHLAVTAVGSTTAGNTFSVTVKALDASNLTTTAYRGTVRFSSTDLGGGVALPSDYTFTAADNGVKTFTGVKLTTAGLKSITATDTATGSIVGSANITVTPAAATYFTLTAPSGTPAALPFNVTVTALDAFNNTATGYRGAIHFSTTDTGSGIALPADYTFTAADNGVRNFTGIKLSTAGPQTLAATDKANGTINGSAPITVTPASATHFTVSAPTNTTAGDTFSVTVTALDGNNNTATNYLGTIHFTSSDTITGVAFPADYAFTVADAGVHVFTGVKLLHAGVETVTATDTLTSAITGVASVTVAPSSAAVLGFNQQPSNTSIGAPMVPAVTVRLTDIYKNLLTTDNTTQITISLGNNPAGATLGGTLTKTVAGGIATFNNLTLDKIGTGYTLVATSGSIAAPSTSFDVVAVPLLTNALIEGFDSGNLNAYTTVGSSRTATLTAGSKHDGTAGLQDANGTDWIYRNDAAVQVKAGDTVSVWLNFSGKADGRAYFGFGTSATGTLSLIAAANTKQLILDVNNGYGFADIAAAPFTFAANKWYKLQVNWGATGTIVGKLFDSNGTTLLQQVTGVNTTITAGGLAFRGTTSNKFWDTVTLTQAVNPAAITAKSSGSIVAAATTASPTVASKPLGVELTPSSVVLMPSTIPALASSVQSSKTAARVATARTSSFYEVGQSIAAAKRAQLQRSVALARSASLTDWTIDPSTLEAVAEGKLAAATRA